MKTDSPFCAVLVAVLLGAGAAGGLPSAHGQAAAEPDTTAQSPSNGPTPHGRWGVGGQLLPLFGPSVRVALTRRVTVQVAGLPFPGRQDDSGDPKWTVGGQGLYKFVVGPWYNVFVGVSMQSISYEETVQKGDDLQNLRFVRRQKVDWVGAATVGVEGVVGSRLGISLEVGMAEVWGEFYVSRAIGGVGLHYYW
jgi:hypothetical protein